MTVPLSESEIKELNEISKLNPEEQKIKLSDFLSKLTPEQVEFLQNQQTMRTCPFCDIVSGKISARKVYEDGEVLAVLDINPANKGHVILMPKKHYAILGQMPDNEVSYIFKIANNISKKIFDSLNAEGTNILVANGAVAGQVVPHVLVHIVPRYKDDGVNLTWTPKQLTEDEMNSVTSLLFNVCNEFNVKQELKIKKIIEKDVEDKKEKVKQKKEEKRIP